MVQVTPELRQEIKELLVSTLGFDDVSPEAIDPDALLFDEAAGGLGIDSVDALEITAALQRRYGLRIGDQTIGRFVIRTVNTIAMAVARHQAGLPPTDPEAPPPGSAPPPDRP